MPWILKIATLGKKSMNKKAVQVVEGQAMAQAQPISIEALMAQAIDKNVSPETMEKLMAMRREIHAEKAREEFNIAMAQFQVECPIIQRKKEGSKTKTGIIAFHYAPLEDIIGQTKDLIQQHGFSYIFKTEKNEKSVKATCIVNHAQGHSENSSADIPIGGGTPLMTTPQVVSSIMTFAKRLAFSNAFGIVTGYEDTDTIGLSTAQEDKIQELVIEWQAALESAGTVEELQKTWAQVPPQAKKQLTLLKNNLKKKYVNSTI